MAVLSRAKLCRVNSDRGRWPGAEHTGILQLGNLIGGKHHLPNDIFLVLDAARQCDGRHADGSLVLDRYRTESGALRSALQVFRRQLDHAMRHFLARSTRPVLSRQFPKRRWLGAPLATSRNPRGRPCRRRASRAISLVVDDLARLTHTSHYGRHRIVLHSPAGSIRR